MHFDLAHPLHTATNCGEATVAQFWAFTVYRKYYTIQRQPCTLTELRCSKLSASVVSSIYQLQSSSWLKLFNSM